MAGAMAPAVNQYWLPAYRFTAMSACSCGLIVPHQCPSRILKPSLEKAPARSSAALRASTSWSVSAAFKIVTETAATTDNNKIDPLLARRAADLTNRLDRPAPSGFLVTKRGRPLLMGLLAKSGFDDKRSLISLPCFESRP